MKFSNIQIICVCIFSAMWGVIEIFIGALLHQIPGKPIPTAMTIMIFVIPILTILYEITGSIKAILLTGLIAAILKFSPFLSIIIETGIFSAFFFIISNRFKNLKILLAGILTAAGGSTIGSLLNSFIFGFLKGKTAKYIIIFIVSKLGTGIIGGIIGSLLAIIILKKLRNHPLLKNK